MHPKDFQSLLNIYLMKQNINFFYRHTGFKDKFCEILIDNAQAIINFSRKNGTYKLKLYTVTKVKNFVT